MVAVNTFLNTVNCMFVNQNLNVLWEENFFKSWKVKKTSKEKTLFKTKNTYTWIVTDGRTVHVTVADSKTSKAVTRRVTTLEEIKKALKEELVKEKLSKAENKKWEKIKKRILKLKTHHRWINRHDQTTVTALRNVNNNKMFKAVGVSENWQCICKKDGSVFMRDLENGHCVVVPAGHWLIVETGSLKQVGNEAFNKKYKKLKNLSKKN